MKSLAEMKTVSELKTQDFNSLFLWLPSPGWELHTSLTPILALSCCSFNLSNWFGCVIRIFESTRLNFLLRWQACFVAKR